MLSLVDLKVAQLRAASKCKRRERIRLLALPPGTVDASLVYSSVLFFFLEQ